MGERKHFTGITPVFGTGGTNQVKTLSVGVFAVPRPVFRGWVADFYRTCD